MYCVYHGHVLYMYWACTVYIMGMYCTCIGHVLCIPWACTVYIMGMYYVYHCTYGITNSTLAQPYLPLQVLWCHHNNSIGVAFFIRNLTKTIIDVPFFIRNLTKTIIDVPFFIRNLTKTIIDVPFFIRNLTKTIIDVPFFIRNLTKTCRTFLNPICKSQMILYY